MSTFVLVPGAGGAAWYWSRLVPEVQRTGDRAVALDLPGDDPSVGLEGYIEQVVEALRAERAADPAATLVLVGQSFGGFSALAAAERCGVDAVVLVNAMIPRPGESGAQWWRTVGQARARRENEARAGRDPARAFDALDVFFHDAPPDVRAEAADHDREQSAPAFEQPWPGQGRPGAPVSVLVSDDDRLFPPAWQRAIARDRLGLEARTVPGGHLNAMSRPRELAEALRDVAGQIRR